LVTTQRAFGGNSALASTNGGGTAAGEGGTTRTAGGTSSTSPSGGTAAVGEMGGSSKGGQLSSAGASSTVSRGGSTSASSATGGKASSTRPIAFGTLLDASAVIASAQQIAKSAAKPGTTAWQAKGDQHRTYRFAEANTDEPYRLYVPTTWDGQAKLPLVMFLHGSGSTENTYVDADNKLMISLAQQQGFILVAPLGDQGAYGNFLRLSAPFGKPDEAAKLMAAVTTDSERTNELSEKDVINVLELVLNEYPIDRGAVFLTGHSMGSGGTWYIGGKYATYWTGLAPMSGPFVQETGYPWESIKAIPLFVTEGTQAPSLDGSRTLRDWLTKNGFTKFEYKEVNADHGGMVHLVLPDVFDFFARSRAK
jgi:predicted peptidase